jgi:hypothetical protein
LGAVGQMSQPGQIALTPASQTMDASSQAFSMRLIQNGFSVMSL